MIHYFCFGIEPAPDNPKFAEIQAGWAHVHLMGVIERTEEKARSMVESASWLIQSVKIAGSFDESHLPVLPPEIQRRLLDKGVSLEVAVYPRGSGPEEAGDPFP
ncbi:MAG: hypothetical protein ABSE62_13240 [Chthoniobacteraceae bacterium]|jgi:hypothetical protein